MVYMLLIYAAEADWVNNPADRQQAVMDAHDALENELRRAGRFRGCGGLAMTGSARTVRFRGGKPKVHDGPFAETKEQFGGFYLVEAASMDEALAVASRIPGTENRAIEVREVALYSAA